MSLMEAASSGRAIIASDVPGCREIAINNLNAITFPYEDPNALSNAILALAKDKKLRLDYSLKGRGLVESDMSIQNVCKSYLYMYKSMIINKI
mgnify:CR=1 FL=1